MKSADSIHVEWNRGALDEAWAEVGALSVDDVAAAGHVLAAGAEMVGDRYPAFQFAAGRRATVQRILEVLGGTLARQDGLRVPPMR